ncbi:MAG: hypothetical protein [Microviridae sp.]|nr:MAG: hypothetical protein [Microviridae sp.]
MQKTGSWNSPPDCGPSSTTAPPNSGAGFTTRTTDRKRSDLGSSRSPKGSQKRLPKQTHRQKRPKSLYINDVSALPYISRRRGSAKPRHRGPRKTS